MGWLDKIFKKEPVNTVYADMLNGNTPIFSQFGNDIYASDVVQQAINCIVSEIKKTRPTHIIKKSNNDIAPVIGNIQDAINNPNQLMTTSELIEKVVWQLYLNFNAFVIPVYKTWVDMYGKRHKEYTELYPIQPTQVDFIQDASNTLYIKFGFENGYETTFPYADVIHIRRQFSVNEFMGGNQFGQPDNTALLDTLKINNDLLHGVSAAVKQSYAVNGVVKIQTLMDREKNENALKEFEEKLRNSASGFLPLDLKHEFIPIKRDIKIVDEGTLKFIDEKILRHYGMSVKILSGNYTKEEYQAFYQKTLEPVITDLNQGFGKGLLSLEQRKANEKIEFFPKDLIFMSVEQTIEMLRILGDSGTLYENEKRVAMGLMPLKELEGIRMQSLNYVNVNIAQKYQIKSKEKEEKVG